MKAPSWIFLLLVLSLANLQALAQEWGVQTTASITDIYPGNGQRNTTNISTGRAGVPFSDAFIDDLNFPQLPPNTPRYNRGTAHAFADLRFANNTPAILRAEASLTGNTSGELHLGQAPNGAVADASAFASDLFQYTGTTPTALSVSFNLEGIVSDTPADNTLITGIYARMAVLANTPNYHFLPFLDTLVFELGATLWDSESLQIDQDTGGLTATRTGSLSFSVNPGDTFYVWQKLNVAAVRGARFADAFHTLTSTFSEPQNVRSLSVPEPTSIGLLTFASAVTMLRRMSR
jgi:hypothetical protein